uniref:Uncharacterized protein n=1 Tax=viral metagenome TaxID=1070528 RepID=A0A6C0F960_9ZZZZ
MFLKITYRDLDGLLDVNTNYVYFYGLTFSSICTAVKSYELINNVKNHRQKDFIKYRMFR